MLINKQSPKNIRKVQMANRSLFRECFEYNKLTGLLKYTYSEQLSSQCRGKRVSMIRGSMFRGIYYWPIEIISILLGQTTSNGMVYLDGNRYNIKASNLKWPETDGLFNVSRKKCSIDNPGFGVYDYYIKGKCIILIPMYRLGLCTRQSDPELYYSRLDLINDTCNRDVDIRPGVERDTKGLSDKDMAGVRVYLGIYANRKAAIKELEKLTYTSENVIIMKIDPL